MKKGKSEKLKNLPLPDLKYGLGISFDAEKIRWPAGRKRSKARTSPRVSVSGCRLHDLAQIRRGPLGRIVRQVLGRLPQPADRVAAWHQAAATGAVVVVEAGVRGASVVVDTIVGTADVASDLVVIAKAGSQVTVIEHDYSGKGVGRAFRSGLVILQADEGAQVTHIRMQDLKHGIAERNRLAGEAKAEARVTCLEAIFGADYAQSDTNIALVGEGAEATVKTVFFGSAGNKFDLSASVEHKASDTVSSIDVRGALSGNARAVSRGLIRVNRGTLRCDGRQDLRGLLLSDKARMDALPQLEIDSEDVRCGHGASIGRLDKEALFYLTSRGLETSLAKKMLVEGFFSKAIEAMRGSGLEQTASCIISERLDKAAVSGKL